MCPWSVTACILLSSCWIAHQKAAKGNKSYTVRDCPSSQICNVATCFAVSVPGTNQTYHACYKRKESKIRSPCVYIQIIRNSASSSLCQRSQCASSTHDCIRTLAYLYCVCSCSLGIQVHYQRCLRRIGLTFSRLEFVHWRHQPILHKKHSQFSLVGTCMSFSSVQDVHSDVNVIYLREVKT